MNSSQGSLEDLVRQGLLKRGQFTPAQIRARLDQARDHLDTARHQKKPGPKHHYPYHAMLSAAMAVLNQCGFRPPYEAHHTATIEGARHALSEEFHTALDLMDKMRQKRHRELYDGAGYVSSINALQALDTATRFVADISKLLGF